VDLIGKSTVQSERTVAPTESDLMKPQPPRRALHLEHLAATVPSYQPYAFDGVVVLAVVTRDHIALFIVADYMDPKEFVLVLEQHVTHHFPLIASDPRFDGHRFLPNVLHGYNWRAWHTSPPHSHVHSCTAPAAFN
jgi:hypothetical protein